jgi:molecular chaperone GrpE
MSEARKIKVTDSNGEEDAGLQPNGCSEPVCADGSSVNGTSNGETKPSEGADLDAVQAKLAARDQECRETYDRLLRVTADFENYKKRMSREMEDFRRYANQSLLKEMVSVVDHIELAIQAAACPSSEETSLIEGLNITLKEFLRILEKFKVKPIEAVGRPFNPQVHEAIMQESCGQFPENTVVREMQKGYTIGDRLLRPSLVVVAAAPPRSEPDPASNAN